MDVFFQDIHENINWCIDQHIPIVPVNQSAFVPYDRNVPINEVGNMDCGVRGFSRSGSGNMNKRMMEFLRRSWPESVKNREFEKERGIRHMMNERIRREKQKQCYFTLHSQLPRGTKNDKNSIVQAAVNNIQELRRQKEELERRNWKLKSSLGIKDVDEDGGGSKIRVKIAYPASGVDSMLEILKCLDNLELKVNAIQSHFSSQELSTVVEIQNEIEAAKIEKVILSKLHEAERKLPCNYQHGWSS